MKGLTIFIKESLIDNDLQLSRFDKDTLLEYDKEFGELMMRYREDRNWKDTLNLEQEWEKFKDAYDKGEKYYPILKFHKCTFIEDHLLEDMTKLRDKFLKFDCPISKYYIENLNNYIFRIKYTIKKITNAPNTFYLGDNGYDFTIDNKYYDEAIKVVKANPYDASLTNDRNINAKDASKMMQDHIDKMGYKWKIEMNDEMLPRMNVNPNGVLRVNSNAKFNEKDIEGLKAHEIDGHVGRRYYGYQTGLHLFVHGLNGRNIYDEGLAVWNSLNKVKEPKPNIMFNIAIKTIISFNTKILDFFEIFDLVKKLAPNLTTKKIFKMIIRTKKEIVDMKLPGSWPDDASYFCGYKMVDAMNDEQRDDILKYNIGPNQFDELPMIKKFLEVNKFEPLEIK